ncbi:MAG: threonine synthase [Oscillospiraceae bacterium]|nr:threonine synthase [Oscillospiraceae bacterium]
MQYISTRNAATRLSSAQAISRGLSREGGLFVPELVPLLPKDAINKYRAMSYQDRAAAIMGLYLTDYTKEELDSFVKAAYGPDAFDTPEVAPVKTIDDNTHFLELWHGPTCAFKDMALQMLPHLLTAALIKTGEEKQVCILVATSGDTGKAALEGFRDVDRTKIMVFYPRDGVSDIQKLQMTSQAGENVGVCAVAGNFDDAQTGVKAIFSDPKFRAEIAEKGWFLSSANSINWGRLLPQIVYYISAYCDLVNRGAIENGQEINFCVPTGNFGDILAGWYARAMGLPVKKLICASNRNDVLTEFLNTGVYNRVREFYTSISPSMDILVSSNLERLLFELSGQADEETAGYMTRLTKLGRYEVTPKIKSRLDNTFAAGFRDDEQTKQTIGEVFKKHSYLIDTHTAVAYGVLEDYRKNTGDDTPCVVVSTASPYKFCAAVLEALGDKEDTDGVGLIDKLSQVSGTKAPAPLAALKTAKARFDGCAEKDAMLPVVREFLA